MSLDCMAGRWNDGDGVIGFYNETDLQQNCCGGVLSMAPDPMEAEKFKIVWLRG